MQTKQRGVTTHRENGGSWWAWDADKAVGQHGSPHCWWGRKVGQPLWRTAGGLSHHPTLLLCNPVVGALGIHPEASAHGCSQQLHSSQKTLSNWDVFGRWTWINSVLCSHTMGCPFSTKEPSHWRDLQCVSLNGEATLKMLHVDTNYVTFYSHWGDSKGRQSRG